MKLTFEPSPNIFDMIATVNQTSGIGWLTTHDAAECQVQLRLVAPNVTLDQL